MTDRRDKAELVKAPPPELESPGFAGARSDANRRGEPIERATEPPVVARLVVEIRSDGSRTIARGAVEDTMTGQRATIEARGDSPLQLALALARSLTQLPRLTARSLVSRALLGRRRDR